MIEKKKEEKVKQTEKKTGIRQKKSLFEKTKNIFLDKKVEMASESQPKKKSLPKQNTNKPATEKKTLSNKVQRTGRQNNTRNKKSKDKMSIKVAFLGGLNEIGKNITVFECGQDMFILDCGMAFPDAEMLGVDLVLPNFSYIEKNIDKIKGMVITHGHEDHIGAIPYLLKNVNVPIYGTDLTIGLISGKLEEHKLRSKAKLNVVKPGQTIKFGCMTVELIHVNHSIPDAVGVAIHSPAGTLVHTGDFKIDFTPAQGKMIDLGKFAELGNNGVLALFADSTNAERPGYTMTEKKIQSSFDNLFKQAENKRVIIASFASNIGRIQQMINCAVKYDRKVAFSGRSMLNYIEIAGKLGYLQVPAGVIVEIDALKRYPKEKTVLITTGSQGEPMSALSRMATGDHRQVSVGPDDFIIISANPIPGNEKMVGSVINALMKQGCTVVYESIHEIHVSGHACQEELKIIQALVKPKYFIPVHGEQKHLRRNAEIAKSMGMNESNIYIGDIGDVVELSKDSMKLANRVTAGRVFVDGSGVGDVGNVVLKDRKLLSEDGLIVVVCAIDFENNVLISGPDIISRGFVYVRESETLMELMRKKVLKAIDECNSKNVKEWGILKTTIRNDLAKLIHEQTKRSPMILPIIMEVKK